MQGYILKITQAKNEDLIVNILTPSKLYTLYRFYGARHSTINVGYKIDFTIEHQIGYMDRLRNITHLGFPWQRDLERMLLWQRFMKVLYEHLRGIEDIASFYYHLLEDLSKRITRQDPKRALIEGYVRLLEYEGRLLKEPLCFVCERKIEEDPVVVRSYLLAHTACIPKHPLKKSHVAHLFTHKDAQYLSEEEVAELFEVMMQGL